MKRILVIDDLRFLRVSDDAVVVYARTSKEGTRALMMEGPWDAVWWDHDLGGEDTTMPCLTAVEECYSDNIPVAIGKCVVHTSNPSGAEILYRSLSRMYPTVRVDARAAGAVVPHQ